MPRPLKQALPYAVAAVLVALTLLSLHVQVSVLPGVERHYVRLFPGAASVTAQLRTLGVIALAVLEVALALSVVIALVTAVMGAFPRSAIRLGWAVVALMLIFALVCLVAFCALWGTEYDSPGVVLAIFGAAVVGLLASVAVAGFLSVWSRRSASEG